MKKDLREKIWLKYDKRCAYCGRHLEYSQLQIDHIEPIWRNIPDHVCKRDGLKKGSDDEENLNPACARCNRWKSTLTIEKFRKEIAAQTMRLMRDSANYRMAADFDLIEETGREVKFHFETLTKIE